MGRGVDFLSQLHFVQRSRSDEATGWDTFWVSRDRETAQAMAEEHERSRVFVADMEGGQEITDEMVTIARVLTTDEMLETQGVDGLIRALSGVRVQLRDLLNETLGRGEDTNPAGS